MAKNPGKAFEDIAQEVDSGAGIALVPMWRLRDAAGFSKLGANVVKTIAGQLDKHSLGSLPPETALPISQNEEVRIYRQGSPVADLVQAVMYPSGKGDQLLRQLSMDDREEILDQIRMLVGA